jgi:hypothetical protein
MTSTVPATVPLVPVPSAAPIPLPTPERPGPEQPAPEQLAPPRRPLVRQLPELTCDMPVVASPRTPAEATPAHTPSRTGPGTARTAAEARLQAHVVLRQILEVLDGRRPAIQLADLVTEPVLRYLTSAAGRLDDPRYGRTRPATRRSGLLRAGASERGSGAGLRSMRVCHPVDGVAEVSVVWRYRGRFRALAARFELTHPTASAPRWRCTVLRLG